MNFKRWVCAAALAFRSPALLEELEGLEAEQLRRHASVEATAAITMTPASRVSQCARVRGHDAPSGRDVNRPAEDGGDCRCVVQYVPGGTRHVIERPVAGEGQGLLPGCRRVRRSLNSVQARYGADLAQGLFLPLADFAEPHMALNAWLSRLNTFSGVAEVMC